MIYNFSEEIIRLENGIETIDKLQSEFCNNERIQFTRTDFSSNNNPPPAFQSKIYRGCSAPFFPCKKWFDGIQRVLITGGVFYCTLLMRSIDWPGRSPKA